MFGVHCLSYEKLANILRKCPLFNSNLVTNYEFIDRKPRKKRPHLLRKDAVEDYRPVSPLRHDQTTDSTSCNDVTSKDKNGYRLAENTAEPKVGSKTCEFQNTSNKVEKRKLFSMSAEFDSKRQKIQLDKNSDIKYDKNDDSTPKFWSKKMLEKAGNLKLVCSFSPKVALTPITVTKMTLRRRHSTPTVGGAIETIYNGGPLIRTLSVGVAKLMPDRIHKEVNTLKMSGEEDPCVDIEFVDSPDSGFSSETSCSAGTPDVETVRNLNTDDPKRNLLRVHSGDSGIVTSNEGFRLNLDGEAVLQKERLERERKRKEGRF